MALSYCKDLGGWLFISLNGTQDQLDFFYKRVENDCFWMGITTNDPSTWKTNNEGVAKEKIIWARDEPNNWQELFEDKTLDFKRDGQVGLSDAAANHYYSCRAVCEMPIGII